MAGAYGGAANEIRTKSLRDHAAHRAAAGQMIADMEKAKPGPAPADRSRRASHAKPLANPDISHTQASRRQKLAASPEADFEAGFACGNGWQPRR
jgi:hypothetical protein